MGYCNSSNSATVATRASVCYTRTHSRRRAVVNATLASALNKKIGKLQHELEQTQYKLASARNLVSSLEKRLETLQDRIMLLEMEMEE